MPPSLVTTNALLTNRVSVEKFVIHSLCTVNRLSLSILTRLFGVLGEPNI